MSNFVRMYLLVLMVMLVGCQTNNQNAKIANPVVFVDPSFGNRGTLWSGMPSLHRRDTGAMPLFAPPEDEYHYLGGTSFALHLSNSGSVDLVVWGWDKEFPANKLFSSVRLVKFPSDGLPREYLRNDGTSIIAVSQIGQMAYPLASCRTTNGALAVLIREGREQRIGLPYQSSYAVYIIDPAAQLPQATQQAVDAGWLHDTTELLLSGTVRMALDNTDLAIVSSNKTRIRLTRMRPAGTVPQDIDLAGTRRLPGLVRLEVASVRFNAGTATISLTAYLNHPGVGATSLGAVLRLLADGSRDTTFGDSGLWVSPLDRDYRGFICAGEMAGIIAGCVERRVLAFGLDPSGAGLNNGLNNSFGDGGITEYDLGGSLSQPIMTSDNSHIYIFAQRSSDLRAVGCRFYMLPGATNWGHLDDSWGSNGKVTIHCDGAPITPTAIAVAGSQVFFAGTRQLYGQDCDRIPVVVSLATSDGDPNLNYGAGGFSLHGSVNYPALIAPDGSAIFAERSSSSTSPALRVIKPSGELGSLISLAPLSLPSGSIISTLTRLADGSLIVTGGGAQTWVAKLNPAGAFDTSFGTGGVLNPAPSTGPGYAEVIGVGPTGDLTLQIKIPGNTPQLAVMDPSGQLNRAYGTGGFVDVEAFMHYIIANERPRCFLDEDGTVICVVSSYHEPGNHNYFDPKSIPVHVSLRRITTAGVYDPNFGLGVPSVNPPANDRTYILVHPFGRTHNLAEYQKITPIGIARLGNRLYLVATGWSGGKYISAVNRFTPSYPLLLVMGWNTDGTVDTTYAGTGWQEMGLDPNIEYWSAAGVMKNSLTSFLVYGMAGDTEEVTDTIDGKTITSTVIRAPQPALFRVEHPSGLDLNFGSDGAARLRVQEVLLSPIAGTILSERRVRIACVDVLTKLGTNDPQTNLGGLAQWQLIER